MVAWVGRLAVTVLEGESGNPAIGSAARATPITSHVLILLLVEKPSTETTPGDDRVADQQTSSVVDVKAKKPRPHYCFRCKCSGHLNDACKADNNCFVCNKKNAHLASKCPLTKMPNPRF
jgi:hypothetical protein